MRPCVVLSYFQGGIELSLDLVCRRYLNKRKTPQLVVNAMGNFASKSVTTAYEIATYSYDPYTKHNH